MLAAIILWIGLILAAVFGWSKCGHGTRAERRFNRALDLLMSLRAFVIFGLLGAIGSLII